jgi:enediyne biosynthesis protein E4
VHDTPDLFRLTPDASNHWITLKLVGTKSNRSAIGARVRVRSAGGTQMDEVRGGGSYYAQNDLRVHFGLGKDTKIDVVDVRWPNGLEETWMNLGIDRIVTLKEGGGARK